MPDARAHQVTELLQAIDEGDEQAGEQLLPLVYEELRKLAHHRMAREPAGLTLQATALVHEAYLRLVGPEETAWRSRGHFFGAAAEAMRRILIDAARKRRLTKHGGGRRRVPVGPDDLPGPEEPVDLLLFNEALCELETRDERMGEVVKLRFFAGLTVDETAAALGRSRRTVLREWSFARAWLQQRLGAATNSNDGD